MNQKQVAEEQCIFLEELPVCVLEEGKDRGYEIRLTNRYSARCCMWIPCQFPDRKCEIKEAK